jgi:arylsulfatase A-like enzyme
MVESVDDATGRILAALDELGIADRTVVVFTSDNGGLDGVTSNLPLRSGKGYPYEGGIRVPWIVRWPGVVAPGTVCDEPVASVDLLPTIREAAGIARDGDDGPTIDGRSLVPLLAGKGSIERDAIFWHFPHYRGRDVVPYSIVRAGDWKLIRRYEGKEHELYDLASDLPETTDLSEKRPEKVKELERLLDAWLRDVRARMPIPNPDHEPDAPSKQEDDGRER